MFRRLSAHPSSVAQARRLVREELATGGLEELTELAELLVSEVVTNALVHAGTPVEVRVRVQDGGLRVEVSDGSPQFPVVRHYSSLTATGRGLLLVDELVDRWGVEAYAGGKRVWLELDAVRARPPHGGGRRVDRVSATAPEAPGALKVTLVNMPLLLHAAWQLMAESLLREFLLSRMSGAAATAEIERHAAASDALALLDRQVPHPELPDGAEAAMSSALEPAVTRDRVTVAVPQASVAHFGVLAETFGLATSLLDAGSLSSPPLQPELRMLPAWLCAEVERQAAGAEPTAWGATNEGPASLPPSMDGWDPAAVASAPRPVIAAGDTDVILAVSDSALDLLGYGAAEELVGRRLLDIVPERYRQAHLAGFTLHLFAGRGPMFERAVVVPALCRDGSEVEVELTLHAEGLPSGRTVFLADLAVPRISRPAPAPAPAPAPRPRDA